MPRAARRPSTAGALPECAAPFPEWRRAPRSPGCRWCRWPPHRRPARCGSRSCACPPPVHHGSEAPFIREINCHDPDDEQYFASSMDWNLTHVRTLQAVVGHGSFSRAAETLHLSQPAVSLHIRQLEDRAGHRLLERVGKRAFPTKAGEVPPGQTRGPRARRAGGGASGARTLAGSRRRAHPRRHGRHGQHVPAASPAPASAVALPFPGAGRRHRELRGDRGGRGRQPSRPRHRDAPRVRALAGHLATLHRSARRHRRAGARVAQASGGHGPRSGPPSADPLRARGHHPPRHRRMVPPSACHTSRRDGAR